MESELTRATVDPRYTWDLTRIYESDEAWETAFADLKAMGEQMAAMAGTLAAGRENVLAAYEEAVREKYRFFSFGDAMFIV